MASLPRFAATTMSTEPTARAPVTYGATLELGAIDGDFAYDPNDLLNDPSRRIGVRIAI